MLDHTPDLDDLAAAIGGSPTLDRIDQELAVGLYRALAEGRPVPPEALARRCRVGEARVTATLAGWPGVFRDNDGAVVGFWGLALAEMAHDYVVGGRRLSTWCAWDALFITPVLGEVAEVASRCPISARPVSLTVGPEGVRRVEPAETVMSFLAPQPTWGDDVITTFCHYVLFLASPEAGAEWVEGHPGTFLVSLADAFDLGRRFNALRFGPALAAEGSGLDVSPG